MQYVETKLGRPVAQDQSGDVRADLTGVDLRRLPAFTTLLVRTVNTVYRVVTTPGSQVYVQGGTSLPNPTAAYLDAVGIGGSGLVDDWIGVGLLMRIRTADECVTTSPVLGIAAERSDSRPH
jgi:hypothetical protein